MTLLQAGVDTSVIALWLGHAGVRSTDAYLHADIKIGNGAPVPRRHGIHRDDLQLGTYLVRCFGAIAHVLRL